MNQTTAFYDSFLPGKQPNKRHTRIVQWLVQFGIRSGDQVLEIGCGPGSVSGMLASQILKSGSLLSIDISPARIERARKLYGHLKHVTFEVADITADWLPGQSFDVIFLPDVLEHIPIKKHFNLFLKLKKYLNPGGFIMVHIPDPMNLLTIGQKQPGKLQPVDQPLFLTSLAYMFEDAGLYVTHLQSYRVWKKVVEYQVICLRRRNWIIDQLDKATPLERGEK